MKLHRIKLLGEEKDLANGFYEIITSGQDCFCLENESYIVNDKILNQLSKKNIKYMIIPEDSKG